MARPSRTRQRRARAMVDAVRRRAQMSTDRAIVRLTAWRGPSAGPSATDPSIALVVVNYSTTSHLKLMLTTLTELDHLELLDAIVIVDNDSRDGGVQFLRSLDARVLKVHVVERRRWLHHGPGLRAGVRRLDELGNRSRAVLFCDPDVVFLDPSILSLLDRMFERGADLVGEHRRRGSRRPGPNIQASFVAVRRTTLRRRDVRPALHDGAPLYAMQYDIERSGGKVIDLPTNRGGLILHRGRAGVRAAADFRPRSAYASVDRRRPHFMGVADGRAVWDRIERRLGRLTEGDHEEELIDRLAERLSNGSSGAP